MRIVVIGPGAVGGCFGGALAKGGADVTFVARGAHLEALQQRGLQVKRAEKAGGDFSVKPRAVAPAELSGQFDVALITVRTFQLDDAIAILARLPEQVPTIIPVLNGVTAHERVGAALGRERVLGGIPTVVATIAEPGIAVISSPAMKLTIGELEAETSTRAQSISTAFAAAGLPTEVSPDIRSALWKKLSVAGASNGVAAASRSTVGAMLACPETRALLIEAMREIVAVGHACGRSIDEAIIDQNMQALQKAEPGRTPSMLKDVEMKRPLELEELQGVVIRLGEEHRIPTPVHRFLYAVLKPHASPAR